MRDSIKAYSKTKSLVKKSLKEAGFNHIKVSNGFYYFSGFAVKNDKVIYFSISDVRSFPDNKILLRTAKDFNDFTGGSNNYANHDKEDIKRISLRLAC